MDLVDFGVNSFIVTILVFAAIGAVADRNPSPAIRFAKPDPVPHPGHKAQPAPAISHAGPSQRASDSLRPGDTGDQESNEKKEKSDAPKKPRNRGEDGRDRDSHREVAEPRGDRERHRGDDSDARLSVPDLDETRRDRDGDDEPRFFEGKRRIHRDD